MMGKPESYRVVYVEPGKPACVKEIGTQLEDIQEAVGGGLFECVYLFAANELKSTVAAFAYREGNLKLLDVCSAIPDDFEGETYIAAIRVRGERIYVSNRGHDSVAVLRFDGSQLELLNTCSCGGQTPRDFCFAGKYVLCTNQDSDTVTVLDEENGYRIVGSESVDTPICVCAVVSEKDV